MGIGVGVKDDDARERTMGEGCGSQFHPVCQTDPRSQLDPQEQNGFLLLH